MEHHTNYQIINTYLKLPELRLFGELNKFYIRFFEVILDENKFVRCPRTPSRKTETIQFYDACAHT